MPDDVSLDWIFLFRLLNTDLAGAPLSLASTGDIGTIDVYVLTFLFKVSSFFACAAVDVVSIFFSVAKMSLVNFSRASMSAVANYPFQGPSSNRPNFTEEVGA